MNWIKENTTLHGETVDLLPMAESHFGALIELAKEKRIWEFIPIDMSTEEKCKAIFLKGFEERTAGTQFPFVIFHKKENKIIGSTRLMNIVLLHKGLEIGWTWLHPDYWATEVNLECKLLLLNFSFENLKAIRVQLKTDENNIRSRKAIEKIGAQYEGILRQDFIRDNGSFRNSAYFSILDKEWNEKKVKLTALYKAKKKTHPRK